MNTEQDEKIANLIKEINNLRLENAKLIGENKFLQSKKQELLNYIKIIQALL